MIQREGILELRVTQSCRLRFIFLILFSATSVFLAWNISHAKPHLQGIYHTVGKGVTLYRISLAYKIPISRIMEANRLSSPSGLKAGRKLFIPDATRVLPVAPSAPLSPSGKKDLEQSLESEEREVVPDESRQSSPKRENAKPPALGKELDIIWPIEGKINSPFGPRGKRLHAGIDIASPSYQEVKAAMDGEVILARYFSTGYGNAVVLRHDQGFTTVYGHMNVIIAQEGETVCQGQPIGGVGSTGKATGPHLHFEVRHHGLPLDPLPLLPMTLEDFLSKALGKEPPGNSKSNAGR